MTFFSARKLRFAAFALLALGAALSARAQQAPAQPRALAVPATAAWQHAETQIILPPRVAGLRRVGIRDSTAEELDVWADYLNEADGLIATIYLFRTSTPYVALWFDRALATIMERPGWGIGSAAAPAPSGFARPGAPLASGLRASLEVGVPEVRTSALAVAPLGDFLVKIRLSSARLDRAELDALLTRFIEGLRWPAATGAEHAAVPIAPCPEPLRLRRARVVRSDTGDVLMTLLGSAIVAQREGPPPVYCREPGATLQHGVYRAGGSRNSYLVALGDAGIALSVGQALDLAALTGEGGGGRRYSMTLLDREATSALPSFNRLPPPDQAIAVAFGNRGPTISISTDDRPER